MEKEYRYELKYVISEQIADQLKKQLRLVMPLDSHSVSEEYSYKIRSLYFDNPLNAAYYEKINGDEFRKKYRMRIYNDDPSFMRMECKHKDGNWTYKDDAPISLEEAKKILKNDPKLKFENEFLRNFLIEKKALGLRPSVIVDYTRLAFVYPVSNVRITFDEELRSGRFKKDILDPELNTVPVYPDGQMVLEVKCDRFIPEHILKILGSYPAIREAVSKFALCKGV